jgi:hypothetical protein
MTGTRPDAPDEARDRREQNGADAHDAPGDAPREVADCVLCGAPTEYPASTRGATLCPVCEWQEAQRNACSG